MRPVLFFAKPEESRLLSKRSDARPIGEGVGINLFFGV